MAGQRLQHSVQYNIGIGIHQVHVHLLQYFTLLGQYCVGTFRNCWQCWVKCPFIDESQFLCKRCIAPRYDSGLGRRHCWRCVAASEWPGQHTQGRVLLRQPGVASVSSAQSLSASQSQGSQSPSPAAAVSVSDTASRQQVEYQTVLQF